MQTKFPKAFTVAAGAVLGLKQGFQNVLAVGRSFLSVSEGVVEGIFNIGKAILSIPLRSLMDSSRKRRPAAEETSWPRLSRMSERNSVPSRKMSLRTS
jgi:hypothetical protein